MKIAVLKDLARSDTIAERWRLEPVYPAVTAEDEKITRAVAAFFEKNPAAVVHEMLGVKVALDGRLPPYIVYLILNDAYEQGDIALIRKYIDAGDKALVCGAGLGVIAAALAQQTQKAVTLIEADPALEELCARTAKLNGVDLRFIHGAVVPGRKSGDAVFTVSEEFWASSLRDDTYKAAKKIAAPVADLEKIIRDAAPDTLFVDIEGAELGLFTPEIIPRGIRKLFVEIHRPALGNEKWAGVMNDIFALGFRMKDAGGLTHYWER